jgi:fructokinase
MGYIAAIEAGGTKFVCGLGTPDGKIIERTSFPTTTPEETIGRVMNYFEGKIFDAMGIGSFGPVDPRPESPTYGYITSTPKPHWGHYNVLGALKKRFHVPMAFDTDVNAAALGEYTWGASQGLESCLYMTVGTGIGCGAIVNGRRLQGFTHPEMGHLLLRRHPKDAYPGCCPFHRDCLEGLAAGPAVERRWGGKGAELGPDHPAWEIESYYLAQALMNFVLVLMPEKIIIGGGVMKQEQLFPLVRRQLKELLNGYVEAPPVMEHIDEYIVPPALGDNAGLCGALALARDCLA